MAFFFLFYVSVSFAEPFSDAQLKTLGRSLANYKACSDIAAEMGDSVMFSYYSEMYNDSLLKRQNHPKNLSDIVAIEQQKSAIKLAKIDRVNLGKLCLSRFDLLSRKMQENKLMDK